jgi:hypothetical protein
MLFAIIGYRLAAIATAPRPPPTSFVGQTEHFLVSVSDYKDEKIAIIQQQTLGIQDHLVPTRSQQTSNIPCSLEFSELQETLVRANGFSDEFCRSSLTLCSDNDGLLQRASACQPMYHT